VGGAVRPDNGRVSLAIPANARIHPGSVQDPFVETVDDAALLGPAGSRGSGVRRPGRRCAFDVQALQCEGGPGTLAQESLSAGAGAAGDMDGDAESSGRLSGEHVVDDRLLEKRVAQEE
jgi:hypothetical protein